MDISLKENTGPAWQDNYATAAYASEAVVHIMSKEGFSSTDVRMLFESRGGFISRMHRSKEGPFSEENRLLGAILNKLALRGSPSPCGLKVERYILQKAQDAGLLVYEESNEAGRIKFSCTPLVKDLDLMLRICCLPELLIDDSEVNLLLSHYETLLKDSMPGKQFFNKLIGALPNRRLALFVVPACLFKQDFRKRTPGSDDQVDFIIQIPNLKTKRLLRIAIYLGESQNRSDNEDGWIVKRFGQIRRQFWESEVRKLADQISYALQDDILAAAKQLREQPFERKKVITELISLPIAEAQLTQVIAGSIYRNERAEITIGNPQKLSLAIVLEAVRDTIRALSSLYGIAGALRLSAADDNLKPDIEYYSIPATAAFSCSCIAPQSLCACCGSDRPKAIPRPIKRDESNSTVRSSLRFILNSIFRQKEFLEDQADFIEQMLSLRGSIGLLKPGGGKTLAYQLASILQPGAAVVIVPNRYIAFDLEYGLSVKGIHRSRTVLGSEEEHEQMTEGSVELESDFIFLSADTLPDRGYKTRLENIFPNSVNFLVFEEVQALSEWSHSFQVGYLNLARFAMDSCALGVSKPSLIALTSINSRLVLLDIMHELRLSNPYCIVESTSYDRKNIQYEIRNVSAKNHMQVLISMLRATLREYGRNESSPKNPSGLIICAHEDDTGLTGLCKSLRQYLDIPVGIYSLEPQKKSFRLGGLEGGDESAGHKEMQQFKRDELPVIVCSADAAMGLNKENIRFTLHADMPVSLEEFYRQSGRAGHDGKRSSCILFFSEDCESSMHGNVLSRIEYGALNEERMAQEFPGRLTEKRILSRVVLKLLSPELYHDIEGKVYSEIFVSSFPDRLFSTNGDLRVPSALKNKLLEKALYRLLVIGAIAEYEKGMASFKVNVITSEASNIYINYKNYVNRYETEGQACPSPPKGNASSYEKAVMQCGCRLVDYSYQRIKTKKADDTAKLHQAVDLGRASIETFRDYLLESLEQSEIMVGLTAAVASGSWWKVLDEIRGLDGLLGLFFACKRLLKRQPDNPLIRTIAGFCALAFPETEEGNSELMKGFCSLKGLTTAQYRLDVAQRIVCYAELMMPSKKDLILESIWRADPSPEISRLCYEKSGFSNEICYSSLFKLVNGLVEAFKAEGVSDE
jgi:superfamily II DNA helicase RecQ